MRCHRYAAIILRKTLTTASSPLRGFLAVAYVVMPLCGYSFVGEEVEGGDDEEGEEFGYTFASKRSHALQLLEYLPNWLQLASNCAYVSEVAGAFYRGHVLERIIDWPLRGFDHEGAHLPHTALASLAGAGFRLPRPFGACRDRFSSGGFLTSAGQKGATLACQVSLTLSPCASSCKQQPLQFAALAGAGFRLPRPCRATYRYTLLCGNNDSWPATVAPICCGRDVSRPYCETYPFAATECLHYFFRPSFAY